MIKKHSKSKKRTLGRTLMDALPRKLQYLMYRNLVRLPVNEFNDVTFKIAETECELEGAFSLLHDSYVTAGWMKEHASKLRVTKYHALPTTSVLVAIKDSQVIATLSIVREGVLGFPSDGFVDMSHIRSQRVRIAEISGLAVHADYRRAQGGLLWPLLAYMYRYCIQYCGIDHLVVASHPSQFTFYEAILMFKRLTMKPVESYAFANDNPAMCGVLNLRAAYHEFSTVYGASTQEHNLFDYFCEHRFETMVFPRRDGFKSLEPTLTPELLDYFFRVRTDTFEKMSPVERAKLNQLYPQESYLRVLPETDVCLTKEALRGENRFDVVREGRIRLSANRFLKLNVVNASEGGFQATLSDPLRYGETLQVHITVSESETADLQCIPVWNDQANCYGFQIVSSNFAWTNFIFGLKQDLTALQSIDLAS